MNDDFMAQLLDPNAGAIPESEKRRIIARLSKRSRGHAWKPGTGPSGETCKTCKHYTVKMMSKAYRKCGLMRANWTGGAATDIKASDPACVKWEAAE